MALCPDRAFRTVGPPTGQTLPIWQVAPQLLYGQLHKVKSGYKLKSMYTVAVRGTRDQLRTALSQCSAFIKLFTVVKSK